jgi:hypothetical protein
MHTPLLKRPLLIYPIRAVARSPDTNITLPPRCCNGSERVHATAYNPNQAPNSGKAHSIAVAGCSGDGSPSAVRREGVTHSPCAQKIRDKNSTLTNM